MYKLIHKQEKAFLYFCKDDLSFYSINFNFKVEKITIEQYDKNSNRIWESDLGEVSDFLLYKDYILTLTNDSKLFKIDEQTKEVIMQYDGGINGSFYGNDNVYQNKFLARDKEKQHYLFDLDTFKVIKKYPYPFSSFGFRKLINDCLFVQNINMDKGIYQVYNIDMELLWERDFNIDCTYTNLNGNVNAAYARKIYPLDDDKMIVILSGGYSFCFEIKTGKQIWNSKGWTDFFLRISEDEAYTFTNAGSIRKVCLRTGIFLQPKDKYYRLPALTKDQGGIDIYIYSNTVTYHDGLLWFVTNASGLTYIVAVNPHDFHYEWVQKVESRAEIDRVFFNGNRMYLNSKNYELLIYEKV